MPTPGWIRSDRRATLPADWTQRVAYVRNRAQGRCEWPGYAPGRIALRSGVRCAVAGAECDHIGNRLDHSVANLQWLCVHHHQQKTVADRRTRLRSDRRPPERHPGLRG